MSMSEEYSVGAEPVTGWVGSIFLAAVIMVVSGVLNANPGSRRTVP